MNPDDERDFEEEAANGALLADPDPEPGPEFQCPTCLRWQPIGTKLTGCMYGCSDPMIVPGLTADDRQLLQEVVQAAADERQRALDHFTVHLTTELGRRTHARYVTQEKAKIAALQKLLDVLTS